MKMSQDHYGYIYNAIKKNEAIIEKHRACLLKDPRVKDLEKRLRWDMLYTSVSSQWVCDNLYPYLNDDHIDTALRRIFKELDHEH